MSEDPHFFSENDDRWLEGILSGLSEQEEVFDYESMTRDEQIRVRIAEQFLAISNPNPELSMPEDIEKAATRMMGGLASFKHMAHMIIGKENFVIEDKFPDLTVRHAYVAARINLDAIQQNLRESGGTAPELEVYERYYSILSEISKKAVELENNRLMRDQEKNQ